MPSPIDFNDTEMPSMSMARIGIKAVTPRGEPCFKTVLDIGEPAGTWKPVTGVSIRRFGHITILENPLVDANELDSPEIEELATFELAQALPADITDAELRGAKMEMMLDEWHEVVLKISVRGQEYRLTTTRYFRSDS